VLAIAQDDDPESRDSSRSTLPRIPRRLVCDSRLVVGVSWWDDEGVLVAWFRSLLDGHRIYDEIYSCTGRSIVSFMDLSTAYWAFR
jgi:hypothetical protein